MLPDFDLAELLTAKMCHDMAGPIGAMNNGIELLMEDKCVVKDKAVNLIHDSSREAVARLQFFRHIYGTVPPIGEANLDNLKNLVLQMLEGGKVNLDWPDNHTNASDITVSHKLGKILLNVIFICTGIMIHGGKLSVRLQRVAGGKRIVVTSEGTGLKVDELLLQINADKPEQNTITSRNVQMYYTYRYAKHVGVTVHMEQRTDMVIFTLEQLR